MGYNPKINLKRPWPVAAYVRQIEKEEGRAREGERGGKKEGINKERERRGKKVERENER